MALSNLYYTETGSGPPLLLIHGLFDSLETWEKLIPLLSDRFRILAVDLPGFGKSPLPERWGESIAGMVDAVAAFLDEREIDRLSIVGSSMGGSFTLAIAERYPKRVEKMILLNPYGLPATPVAVSVARGPLGRVLPYLLMKPTLKRLARLIFIRSFHDPALLTGPLVERVIRPFVSLRHRKNLFRFLKGIAPREIEAVDALLPRIRHPVLILWGENDRWLSKGHAKRLHKRLPKSEIIFIPACGHLPHMEKPKETAEAVLGHLTS